MRIKQNADDVAYHRRAGSSAGNPLAFSRRASASNQAKAQPRDQASPVNNLPGDVSVGNLPTRPEAGRMKDLVEEFWDLPLVETLHQQGLRKSPDDFRDALHQLLGRRGRLLLTGSARQALRIVLTRAAAGSAKR